MTGASDRAVRRVRRAEILLAIGIGVLAMAMIALVPSGFGSVMARSVVEPALRFWYAGVGLLAVALLLGRTNRLPRAARVLRFVATAWVTLAVLYPVVVVIWFAVLGPLQGP